MNLENFTQVNTINPRKTKSDLTYSTTTGKFTVSESLYERLNLKENGFLLFVSHAERRIALALVPNQDASIMKGKANSVKGTTFTASAMASNMENFYPGQESFSVNFMLENDRVSYYEIVPESQEEDALADASADVDDTFEDTPNEPEGEPEMAESSDEFSF